ncbi:hypothetical protein S101446_02161 [Komagataeibacter europaeus]|nr:hypothetical protein S101446_02161 [Komagataeibacter europaeus]
MPSVAVGLVLSENNSLTDINKSLWVLPFFKGGVLSKLSGNIHQKLLYGWQDISRRLFAAVVLHCYRAGIAWRDLPVRFGDWKNVHGRSPCP